MFILLKVYALVIMRLIPVEVSWQMLELMVNSTLLPISNGSTAVLSAMDLSTVVHGTLATLDAHPKRESPQKVVIHIGKVKGSNTW
jgi:hypothetical protein